MLLEYLLIFFARVCDVTLSTVRMILVVRGKRYPAAAIGLVEASIYITALGRVMRNIDDPLKVLAYGLGFASGTLLGSWVEERLALGHVTLEVIPPEENAEEPAQGGKDSRIWRHSAYRSWVERAQAGTLGVDGSQEFT